MLARKRKSEGEHKLKAQTKFYNANDRVRQVYLFKYKQQQNTYLLLVEQQRPQRTIKTKEIAEMKTNDHQYEKTQRQLWSNFFGLSLNFNF